MQPDISLPKPKAILQYVGILDQESTNAPTIKILQNTLGTIVWTRAGDGEYYGTLPDAFPENKTYIMISQTSNAGNLIGGYNDINSVYILAPNDGAIQNATLEIRVYN